MYGAQFKEIVFYFWSERIPQNTFECHAQVWSSFCILEEPFFPTVPLSTQEYTWLQLTHLVREMKS